MARDDLGRTVVVGHVEGVEAGGGVPGHRAAGGDGVEQRAAALLIGHLPQAGDDARDLEAGGELDARRPRGGDDAHRGGSLACTACTSSVLIWPTVVTSPLTSLHRRNGPTMSPFLSNSTAPITPT